MVLVINSKAGSCCLSLPSFDATEAGHSEKSVRILPSLVVLNIWNASVVERNVAFVIGHPCFAIVVRHALAPF